MANHSHYTTQFGAHHSPLFGAHHNLLQMEPTKTQSKWSPPKPTPIGAHHGGVLQFPRAGTEAVEDLVFTEAVEPFSSGGGRAGHEISSLSLSRAETADNLEEKEGEEKTGGRILC